MPSLRIAVLGSAHLDLLSHIREAEDTLDRPGDLFIGYGGTGFNLAVNFTHLGHHVTFGTVLADTAISRTIVHALQRSGVHVRADFRPNLPEAGFSAHIANGELISAVASCPVELADLHHHHLVAMIEQADIVVAECNLAPTTLVQAATEARHREKPIWIAGVSESKACKVLDMIAAEVPVSGLFLNRRELKYLCSVAPRAFNNPSGLADGIGGVVVETRSADGVAVWRADRREPIAMICPNNHTDDHTDDRRHWLGAGDHLMALAIHQHHGFGAPVEDAACIASQAVTEHHPRQNCNLAPSNPLEERLRHLTDTALRDPLTGLLNRAGLQDFVGQLEQTTRVALLMIDIDHFKRINDTHGHDVGDKVLSGVGAILRNVVRGTDAAVRWGGEEMIVILSHPSGQAGADVAERIRRQVENTPFPPCDRVTCSIGVSSGPLEDLDHLREMADQALYEGKRSGRNRVVTSTQVREACE